MNGKFRNLADLNIEIFRSMAVKLGMECTFQTASEIKVDGKGDERLMALVKFLDCGVYLSGYGGGKYQDVEKFAGVGIRVEYYDFVSQEYPQLWGDFEPVLSIMDALFNEGFQGTRRLILKDPLDSD